MSIYLLCGYYDYSCAIAILPNHSIALIWAVTEYVTLYASLAINYGNIVRRSWYTRHYMLYFLTSSCLNYPFSHLKQTCVCVTLIFKGWLKKGASILNNCTPKHPSMETPSFSGEYMYMQIVLVHSAISCKLCIHLTSEVYTQFAEGRMITHKSYRVIISVYS